MRMRRIASAAAAKKCARPANFGLSFHQSQPGFMNEGGRLQCVPGGFVRHSGSGELA